MIEERWHLALVVDGTVYVTAKGYTLYVANEMSAESRGKVIKRPWLFGRWRLARRARRAYAVEGRGW